MQLITSSSTNAAGNLYTPGLVASSVDNLATLNNEMEMKPFADP
ncbi:hypothetical protein COLO4_32179 [Corchorus olitorius]|uniref:Uncharacterized protein n=1 Tax=Corchorus olitorius TaxID=93759 RepID=A0A1R3H0R6_9ROSI|nr:hypothetical protein COLO4_32179 [Corchorus olitorius]